MKRLITSLLIAVAAFANASPLDGMPTALFDEKEFNCLAKNVYFEARGEPTKGQEAVALVTVNRAKASGHSICKTVYARYQFSWTAKPAKVRDFNAWNKAKDVTYRVLSGSHSLGMFTATHFHATYLPQQWRGMRKVAKIGGHVFYT